MMQRGIPSSTGGMRSPFQLATEVYGAAFDGATVEQVAESMRGFKELPETDKRYIQCHLSYLSLQYQQSTQVMLARLLELLNYNTGAVHALANAILPRLEAGPAEGGVPVSAPYAPGAGAMAPQQVVPTTASPLSPPAGAQPAPALEQATASSVEG